jgi:hypothetical protein
MDVEFVRLLFLFVFTCYALGMVDLDDDMDGVLFALHVIIRGL